MSYRSAGLRYRSAEKIRMNNEFHAYAQGMCYNSGDIPFSDVETDSDYEEVMGKSPTKVEPDRKEVDEQGKEVDELGKGDYAELENCQSVPFDEDEETQAHWPELKKKESEPNAEVKDDANKENEEECKVVNETSELADDPVSKRKKYDFIIQRYVKDDKLYNEQLEKLSGLNAKVRFVLQNTDGNETEDESVGLDYYDTVFEQKYPCPPDAEEAESKRPLLKKRGLYPVCVCESQKMEALWNDQIPVMFNSQLKQMDYEERRKEKKYSSEYSAKMASSTFIIGKHMKVCLYVNYMSAGIFNVVPLTISHGNNTIEVDSEYFLKRGVRRINFALSHFSNWLDEAYEMNVVSHCVYAEFFKDEKTQWLVLRQYDTKKYCKSRLYISLESWLEFKKLLPMLISISEHYRETIMQGRAVMCQSNIIVPPKKTKRSVNSEDGDEDDDDYGYGFVTPTSRKFKQQKNSDDDGGEEGKVNADKKGDEEGKVNADKKEDEEGEAERLMVCDECISDDGWDDVEGGGKRKRGRKIRPPKITDIVLI